MNRKKLHHEPVLKKELLAFLFFKKVESVFDGTVGLGGHAEAILGSFPNIKKYIACDLDRQHLEFAKKRLKKWEKKTLFINENFSSIKKIIQAENPPRPLIILLDLGLCSNHIDDPEKGFSFEANGPLCMAFDGQKNKDLCKKILNTFPEKEIFKILKSFGEEPLAKKISRAIIEFRKEKEFSQTFDLKNVVISVAPEKIRKKTLMRVFQAFRIAVNNELETLSKTIVDAFEIMTPGDRLGIIGYHGLEDRIVKKTFLALSSPQEEETEFSLHTIIAPAKARLLTKKPISPSTEEILKNPRARSAHLRIIEKIK